MTCPQTILYIEDDESAQLIARYALQTIAAQIVHLCSSGLEAVSEIKALQPDLVLLDVVMPDIDGIETLQRIREAGLHIPVIFMTARDSIADQHRLAHLDAVGSISKPFDPFHLWEDIQALLENA